MTFDYIKTAATAERLLQKFGQAVTLVRPSVTPPVYDPATGINTPGAPASYIGVGALFDYKRTDVNASLVEAGDQRLYLSVYQAGGAAMPEPDVSDSVVLADGVTYSVKAVAKIAPSGTPVLFDVQLQGAT